MQKLKLFIIVFLLSLSLPLFVSAQSWSDPTSPPPGNNASAPLNVSSLSQEKAGSLLLDNGLGITAGNLVVSTGYASSSEFCLGGVCINSWPSGGGSSSSVILSAIHTYTTSGTYTKPSNLAYIVVEAWGGGGGGGEAALGGGGGAYCEKTLQSSSLSSSVSFTVGTGGAGGNPWNTDGKDGSASTFSPCVAGGGKGATLANNPRGGAGGTASGGDLNINGGDGGGDTSGVAFAGSGGDSPRGGPGGAEQGWYGNPAGSGKIPGGGGSGGGTLPNGNGAPGMITVYEYTYSGSGSGVSQGPSCNWTGLWVWLDAGDGNDLGAVCQNGVETNFCTYPNGSPKRGNTPTQFSC